jgi:hypothetical protein
MHLSAYKKYFRASANWKGNRFKMGRKKYGTNSSCIMEEKLVQHRLRWFGHLQRRPPETPVHYGVLSQDNKVRRGRGRPKLTWVETIKRDLKEWDIPRDLCLNRSAWKTAIDVPEP